MPARTHFSSLLWFRAATALLFIGYVWLAFAGKASWHVFFWDEKLLSPTLLKVFGTDWGSFITGPYALNLMEGVSIAAGVLCIAGAVAVAVYPRFPKASRIAIIAASALILLWSALSAIDKIIFTVQFAEHALRWSFPLFVIAAHKVASKGRWLLLLRMAIAVTFAAHGLFALDVFPRPGHFVDMTMSILQLSESGAVRFLIAAGVLDWLAAIGLFLPSRKVQLGAAAYMVIWGLLTTLARWVANVHFSLPWWPQSLMEWTPEVLVRIPHFAGPLLLWTFMRRNRNA